MNVAEQIVAGMAELGVTTVWGVVGDALNPITDAIRREDRISWIGVRHEEVGAFAASAQAQVSGTLGVWPIERLDAEGVRHRVRHGAQVVRPDEPR